MRVKNSLENHGGEMRSCTVCGEKIGVTLGGPHRLRQAWNASIYITALGEVTLFASSIQIMIVYPASCNSSIFVLLKILTTAWWEQP